MSPTNKYLHRILILLIFISVSATAYLLFTPKNDNSSQIKSASSTPNTNIQTEDLKPATLKQKTNDTDKKIDNNPTEQNQSFTPTTSLPTTITTSETVLIKFKIANKDHEITVKPNSSAYEAMSALQSAGKISFSTKVFSGLGHFVEEINGIKNSPNTGFYWTFYINNQEAKTGISTYIIKPNDLITWKYENK